MEFDLNKILEYTKRESVPSHYSVSQLNEDINCSDLNLSPAYQREYVINEKIASTFIESVFLGCVIPEVILIEVTEDGRLEVLDGKQRITSLVNYLNNKFYLKGLQEECGLNGYYYRDLPVELQRAFRNFSLNAQVIRYVKDMKYKSNLFARINIGNKKLTNQEVRNCIYRGPFIEMLKRLSSDNEVNLILPQDKRYQRQEFILKLMAIEDFFPNLNSLVVVSINKFIEKNRYISKENEEKLENHFKTNMLLLNKIAVNIAFFNKKIKKTDIQSIYIVLSLFCDGSKVDSHINKIAEIIYHTITEDDNYKMKGAEVKKTQTRDVVVAKILALIKNIGDSLDVFKKDIDYNSIIEKTNAWIIEMSRKRTGVYCSICGEKIGNIEDSSLTIENGYTFKNNSLLSHTKCYEEIYYLGEC